MSQEQVDGLVSSKLNLSNIIQNPRDGVLLETYESCLTEEKLRQIENYDGTQKNVINNNKEEERNE